MAPGDAGRVTWRTVSCAPRRLVYLAAVDPSLIETVSASLATGQAQDAVKQLMAAAPASGLDDAYHALLDRAVDALHPQRPAPAEDLSGGWPALEPFFSGPAGAGRWWLEGLPELGRQDPDVLGRLSANLCSGSFARSAFSVPPDLPYLLLGSPASRFGYDLYDPKVVMEGGVLRILQRFRWTDGRGTKERKTLDTRIQRLRGHLFHVRQRREFNTYES